MKINVKKKKWISFFGYDYFDFYFEEYLFMKKNWKKLMVFPPTELQFWKYIFYEKISVFKYFETASTEDLYFMLNNQDFEDESGVAVKKSRIFSGLYNI